MFPRSSSSHPCSSPATSSSVAAPSSSAVAASSTAAATSSSAAPFSSQQGRLQPLLPLGSPAMDLFHGAARGVATTAGVRPVGGGGQPLPPQAPPPPRFGAPPRYGEIWPDGHPRPPLPPSPRVGLPHPRPSQPPYSLSHEASGSSFSRAWSVGDEEFLHMSNFDSMERERYYTNLINDESNNFGSSEMGSQFNDEQAPVVNENGAVRSNQKRSKNFSLEEDNLLVSAWINVSLDAVQGTDQSHGTYWSRIYDYFHENKDFDSDRSQGSLIHRWSAIQEHVNKYTGYLSQIQNRNQSGVNPEDMHVQAGLLYKNKEKKKFQFMHCYNVLKNLPKWHNKRTQLVAQKTSNKKQKNTAHSTPAISAPACNADESGVADPENTEGEGRPLGRKKAKQQMRERSDQSRKESLDYLWDKKKEADAEKERKREERYKIAFALGQKRIDLEKEKFEFKRMIEEDRLLRIGTSAMSIKEQEYYQNVKNQILSRSSDQA